MIRTLALRERHRRLVRLDPLDVAFLRSLPRSWIRVEKVGPRHLLTVGGIAGTLAAPTCQVTIAPKISVADLSLLLDAEAPPATTPTATGPLVADALVHTLAAGYLRLLARRVAAGLHHGYREEALAAPVLQGRLDLPAQLLHGPSRPEMLHQVRDAFTPDIACNRLLRAALDALRAVAGLSDATRTEADRLARAMVSIQPLAPADWLAHVAAPRDYAPALDAARLLLGGLAPGRAHGPGATFVLELERLFERYLVRGLAAAAGHGVVEPQARRVLHGDGLSLVVKPDALILRAGEPVRIVDAKWKRLVRGRAPRGDVYQMLAYADVLDVPEGVLVYPGRQTRCRDYPPTRRGTRVRLWTLRLEDRHRLAVDLTR